MAAGKSDAEWSAIFDAADKDSNGFLGLHECAAMLRQNDSTLTDKEVADIFMSLGGDATPAEVLAMMKDQEKTVTKDKFIAGMKKLQEWTAKADKLFASYDKDGSGFLEKSEVIAFIKEVKVCSDAQVRDTAEKIMASGDLNSDGKLTKTEVIAALS